MKKILLVSSSGGHYEQLLIIKKQLEDKFDISVMTEKTPYIKGDNIYFLKQVNRKQLSFLFNFINNYIKTKKYLKKIKPDIVISTGALCTIPVCLIAKKHHSKIVFIESYAKINSPTLTGKFLYKYADYFIVQWEELKEVYPDALYFNGGIY